MIRKLKPYKARMLFSILALFIFSEQCQRSVANRSKQAPAYAIMIHLELIQIEDGSPLNFEDTFTVLQKNNTCMYIISKPYANSYITLDNNDSVVNETVKEGINYHYYLFNSTQQVGVKYDSSNTKKGIEFPVDSLVSSKNFFRSGINLDSGYSLIKKVQVGNFSEVEIYHVNRKPDEDSPDSVYLTFSSKFDKVPYSFSKKLDSTHQKKLSKIQIIYSPLKSNKYSFLIPRRELLFEMQKTSVGNQDSINKLFRTFEERNPIQK